MAVTNINQSPHDEAEEILCDLVSPSPHIFTKVDDDGALTPDGAGYLLETEEGVQIAMRIMSQTTINKLGLSEAEVLETLDLQGGDLEGWFGENCAELRCAFVNEVATRERQEA